MKKPNVTIFAVLLTFNALLSAHAAEPNLVAGGSTTPLSPPSSLAPASAPASISNPAPTPGTSQPATATTSALGATDLVPLLLTPEALSKEPAESPINLSRWYTGASLILVNRRDGSLTSIPFADRASTPFSSLLEEDSSQSVALETGSTSIIIDFHAAQTVERFGFYSFSAAGSVEVKYCTAALAPRPTSSDWKPTNVSQDFAAKAVVSVQLQPLEARFLLITFKIATPGEIGPLAIFGHVTSGKGKAIAPNQGDSSKTGSKNVDPEDLVEFDYATAAFGTKVTHILGGNVTDAQNILTSDPKNKLLFGEKPADQPDTVDEDNIMVVDMGKNRDIDKVALLFATKGNGKFEFYFLNDLPTEEGVKAAATTAANGAFRPVPPAAAGTGNPAAATPSASAPPALPTKAPTPVSWRRADGTVGPLLLAATSGSLAEVLALSQIAADANGVTQLDYLPKNFFSDKKPNVVQNVTPNQEKLAVNFDKNNFRYCLIRWLPSTPNQPPIEVFRVNLIGRVPLDDYVAGSSTTSQNTGSTAVQTVTPPGGGNVAVLDPTSQQGGNGGNGNGGNGNGGNGGNGGPNGGGDNPDPPPTPKPTPPVSM